MCNRNSKTSADHGTGPLCLIAEPSLYLSRHKSTPSSPKEQCMCEQGNTKNYGLHRRRTMKITRN
ncbi:hypothetical protein I79_026092 [Cricetulus griseus]|uniref:Uncharacterized protein n=1 Tax=Cricetulus griseus TaxID=10029 RepID=G3IQ07_CRIGR|nr:hypothetical protein I79_026092 [Cricetulus griseus]